MIGMYRRMNNARMWAYTMLDVITVPSLTKLKNKKIAYIILCINVMIDYLL